MRDGVGAWKARSLSFGAAVLQTIVAMAVAVGITALVVRAAHGNVRLALSSLWDGATGLSFYARHFTLWIPGHPAHITLWTGVTFAGYKLATTLTRTCPLLLTGLGIAIAFRARMWNIGGQGQFLLGAIAAAFFGATCHATMSLPQAALLPIMLIAGTVAGALWAAIPAALKVYRAVPEVISTIMLNFVAVSLMSYLVNGPMQRPDGSQPATAMLSARATLPLVGLVHAGLIVALIAAVVVAIMLSMTRLGFAIRAVGASADAARLAGHSVGGTAIAAMLWSGGLCGLAGAIELAGVTFTLAEGYSPQYGFVAIAVALLGRLNIGGVVLSALLFGGLMAGSENMERTAGIAHDVGYVIQATLLFCLLAAPALRFRRTIRRDKAS